LKNEKNSSPQIKNIEPCCLSLFPENKFLHRLPLVAMLKKTLPLMLGQFN